MATARRETGHSSGVAASAGSRTREEACACSAADPEHAGMSTWKQEKGITNEGTDVCEERRDDVYASRREARLSAESDLSVDVGGEEDEGPFDERRP